MRKNKLKITDLETKSLIKLNSVLNKFSHKIKSLEDVITNCYDFGIPLSELQIQWIRDKIQEYEIDRTLVQRFINWRNGDVDNENIRFWFKVDESYLENLQTIYDREKKLVRL